jgi:hypothetical protein
MLIVVKTFIMQDIAKSHIWILKSKTPRTKVWIPQPRRKAGRQLLVNTNTWLSTFSTKEEGPHSGGPRSRYPKSQGRVRVKVRSKRSTPKKLSMGDNFSFDNFIKSLN